MKLLYVGDLHIGNNSQNAAEELAVAENIIQRAAVADLVFFLGDISDAGRPEQYARFIELYEPIKEKCVLIRGNHDMGDYRKTFQSWIPADAKQHFHPGEYPVWIWTTNYFQMLNANTKCLSGPQSLPEPYNRIGQAPVIVVYDGVGPYYYFEQGGVRFIVLDAATHRLGKEQTQWMIDAIGSSTLPVIIQLHTHIIPAGGPDDACCLLWDSEELIQQFIRSEKILGVFAAHLHYNSVWDHKGKKMVLTGAFGESRFVEVEDGKITSIEVLDNPDKRNPMPDSYRGVFDETPLDLHYWCADGIVAENTFWIIGKKQGFWDDKLPVQTHWGWHDPEGEGGLSWSLPPEFLKEEEVFFSVNFRSTTKWKLVLEDKNGNEEVVCQGEPGENLVATGSYGRGPDRPFRRVILKQASPALGHACCYMALHDTPVPEFRPYHPLEG